jgi:hypothetical protein
MGTQECDKRIVPCLHKICSSCFKLVKENAALIDMWDCCPFYLNEIKGSVGLNAQQVESSVNCPRDLLSAGPSQLLSLSVVHKNLYKQSPVRNESSPADPVAGGANGRGPAACNLFIYYCPDRWGDEELTKAFSVYGKVESTNIIRCPQGVSKCFGFVRLDNHISAQEGIQGLNGLKVEDRRLKVEVKLT